MEVGVFSDEIKACKCSVMGILRLSQTFLSSFAFVIDWMISEFFHFILSLPLTSPLLSQLTKPHKDIQPGDWNKHRKSRDAASPSSFWPVREKLWLFSQLTKIKVQYSIYLFLLYENCCEKIPFIIADSSFRFTYQKCIFSVFFCNILFFLWYFSFFLYKKQWNDIFIRR